MLEYLCLEHCRQCHDLIQPSAGSPLTVCSSCWANLLESPVIQDSLKLDGCGELFIVSAIPYVGVLKKLVYKLKYDNDCLVTADLVLLLERAWKSLSEQIAADFSGNVDPITLVPVPLHWWRQWRRGFNQAHVLAMQLTRKTKFTRVGGAHSRLRVDSGILRRIRQTTPHHGLGRDERFVNVCGAFEARAMNCEKQAPLNVIVIVDDIYTSGATIGDCARALRTAGYSHVYGLTVARALELAN